MSTKKNKKRIAIIVLMIFICYYLLLILGVFPYPKMAVKLFFKANISRFEDTEYMMLNNDDPSDKLYSLPSYEYENNTVDHNFIATFKSIRECERELGIDRHKIARVLRNEIKKDYLGYLFECAESQETIESIA